ncbi:leukotriene B4 receptor 1 [Polypterus senegalus]|uniref:leukotriene B4 receptor 1 n=1 Tax=Polypterus senegalus TaxID=55291 RepID=UPI00196430FA|nr:leukotriene B4 receptor 1 [Polypterus senegalus]
MNVSENASSDEYDFWHIEKTVPCVILGLSFLIGVPGNLLVIYIILRHVKQRSHTVVLILNLAFSDLMALITLPVWIYAFADSWVFGEAFCKFLVYIVYSNMYASIFLITAMSIERFVAVMYPFSLQNWKRKDALLKVVVIIWILAFLFSIPVIPAHGLGEEYDSLQCNVRNYTSDEQEIVCLVLETLVGFIIPFSILSICYACVGKRIRQMSFKTKQRSTTLIACVVIAFAVCWIPNHVFNLITVSSLMIKNSSMETSEALKSVEEKGVFISGALAFISSCVNPILYVFIARRFRKTLRETGLRKLFTQISISTTNEATKEMSFISRKASSTQNHTSFSNASDPNL